MSSNPVAKWRIQGLDGAPLSPDSPNPENKFVSYLELSGVTIVVTGEDVEQENGDILHPAFKYEGIGVRLWVLKGHSRTDESQTTVKLKVGMWFKRFGRRVAHQAALFDEWNSGVKFVRSKCRREFNYDDPRWSKLDIIPDPETLTAKEMCSQCAPHAFD